MILLTPWAVERLTCNKRRHFGFLGVGLKEGCHQKVELDAVLSRPWKRSKGMGTVSRKVY